MKSKTVVYALELSVPASLGEVELSEFADDLFEMLIDSDFIDQDARVESVDGLALMRGLRGMQ